LGAEFFHAGKRTDMTKPVVAFRNFVNAKKQIHFKKYQNDLSEGYGNYMHHLVLHFGTVRFATRHSFVVILTINIIN
jgi:hypothetical protein